MKYAKLILVGKMCLIAVSLFYFSNCTFDNEEELLEDFDCDTTDIVYNDLTYIFSDICSNCHNESFTLANRGNIKIDSYENVKSSINTGLVWPAINHEEGVPPMPNGLPKLSDCDLNKIDAWIDAGMPEN